MEGSLVPSPEETKRKEQGAEGGASSGEGYVMHVLGILFMFIFICLVDYLSLFLRLKDTPQVPIMYKAGPG